MPSNCSQWNDGHHWYVDDTGDERRRVHYYWHCDCGASMDADEYVRRHPEVLPY